MRRFESDAIEKALAESPRRGPDQQRRLILVQIREDFLQIQILNDDLVQAARADSLDLKVVAKGASEIAKRAERLRENLALPESESETEETPGVPGSNPETSR